MQKPQVQKFLKDAKTLFSLATSKKYKKLVLEEYPFDSQLIAMSRLYRESRKQFYDLGGNYQKRLCSTMRSLSAHDLFSDTLEYTPGLSELLWFTNHIQDVFEPEDELKSFKHFNDVSLFHEQNHRVVWRHLPPPPREQRDVGSYLNFAESLVVTLDLALGDEIGKSLSKTFERMNTLYRPGGEDNWHLKSKLVYRKYLLAIFYSTYLCLELIDQRDILKAVDYVMPGQKKLNKDAVRRGLQLNESFTRITNPQWQDRYWKKSVLSLKKLHKGSKKQPLVISRDPLDLESEFLIVHSVLDRYGL